MTLPRWIVTYSDKGKGEATRQLHRWARAGGIQKGTSERDTLLNSWEGAHFNFDEPLLHKMMERSADMGLELFVLDDGWFANKYPRNYDNAGLGDWTVNKKKLPNGVEGLVKVAKDNKIKFGIWVEPEMVNPKSELYETHPDWVIKLPTAPQRRAQPASAGFVESGSSGLHHQVHGRFIVRQSRDCLYQMGLQSYCLGSGLNLSFRCQSEEFTR